jgi:hypothetical protein
VEGIQSEDLHRGYRAVSGSASSRASSASKTIRS